MHWFLFTVVAKKIRNQELTGFVFSESMRRNQIIAPATFNE